MIPGFIDSATVVDDKKQQAVLSATDAEVISETKKEDPIKKDPNLKGSIEVNPDELKSKVHEKISIDFMSEDNLKSHVKKETKFAEPPKPEPTIEQVQAQIKIEEDATSKKWTPKDFEQIAGFIINLVDTGVSTGLRFWSKDTSDYAYSLPEAKKKMLIEQLTLILIKYNTKFSIEFMFLATLILAYAVPVKKAMDRRKLLKTTENKPKAEKLIQRIEVVKTSPLTVVKPEKAVKETIVKETVIKKEDTKKEDVVKEEVKIVPDFNGIIVESDIPLTPSEEVTALETVKVTDQELIDQLSKSGKRKRGNPGK